MGKRFYIHTRSFLAIIGFILIGTQVSAQVSDDSIFKKLDTLVSLQDEDSYDDDTETENAVEAASDTAVFNDKSLLQYSTPDSFDYRGVVPSTITKLKSQDAFWYADKNFQEKPKDDKGIEFGYSSVFDTFLWIFIIAGFIAFLVYYLANSNAGIFRRNVKIKPDEDSDELPEDIFAINYNKEIDKAVNNDNYRLAVRLQFLKLLRNLADRQMIQYTQDRTNFDYLLQLNKSYIYNDFFRLTRHYEYSWYGLFGVDKQTYEKVKIDFEKIYTKLH